MFAPRELNGLNCGDKLLLSSRADMRNLLSNEMYGQITASCKTIFEDMETFVVWISQFFSVTEVDLMNIYIV